jgi:ribonuclease P protein component
MLPEKFRLKIGKNNYRRWTGKTEIYTPLFKVIYRKCPSSTDIKVGFIVTGKVGKAAMRNKIRRWLTEAVKNRIERLPKGTEAVFLVSRAKEDINYETTTDWVNKILPKIY